MAAESRRRIMFRSATDAQARHRRLQAAPDGRRSEGSTRLSAVATDPGGVSDRELLEQPLQGITEIDFTPKRPGIYAWYAVPIAGPLDWGEDFDDEGIDQGGKKFSAFLADHTRMLHHPPVTVGVIWNLWAEWSGTLPESGTQALASAVELVGSLDPGRKSSATLGSVLTNSTKREHLARVLVQASPRLSSPIYIGIAKNLFDRIHTHFANIEEATEYLVTGEDPWQYMKDGFGVRAAAAKLSPASLRFSVLPIPELEGLDDDDLRSVAGAAEYVLNRWHHPILGRR